MQCIFWNSIIVEVAGVDTCRRLLELWHISPYKKALQ